MEMSLMRFSMNTQRPCNSERRDGKMCTNPSGSLLSRKFYTNSYQAINGHPKQGFKRYSNVVTDSKRRPNRTNSRCLESKNLLETHFDGYTQISSQFVLIPGSTYLEMNYDGTPPQWDQVASLKVLNRGDLVCPICLYPPITPRMGKCGHVYCWPCAVQFVKYENESGSKKCSICTSSLALDELKRVSLASITPIKAGDSIRLVLVKRSRSGVTPLLSQTHGETFKYNFDCVHVADPMTLKHFQELEIDELRTYRAICEVDGNNIELIPFIDFLCDELNREESLLECCRNSPTKRNSFSQDNEAAVTEIHFYQAADGQPVFLDSLGWRCLLTEYKEIQNLPLEIIATVVSTKSCRMSSSLRKPLRYLSHLPDGYAFGFVEIKLEPPLVSESTLSQFATALNNRALERDRSRLKDLKLTELKEAAENQFTSLRKIVVYMSLFLTMVTY
ncbi:RING finger protein 10 [Schistosoma japonicum]|nr:RING finger protein 10 [Schistosoma japonicum]